MEASSEFHGRQNPSPKTSPNSRSSSSSCSSNGVQQRSPSMPSTPKHAIKAKTSADPTTFIQADTSSFKQLVQMLTGSSQTAKQASSSSSSKSPTKSSIPPMKTMPKKGGHKLYERRNSFKSLKVSPLVSGLVENCGFSPRELEMLSPSMLDFPSLVISPVTPLSLGAFSRSPSTSYTTSKLSEQGRVVDNGFYLDYSSSSSTPRDAEPRLLPLFPVTSPKIAGST